jgi:uncharacterized membrane protein YkoI
MTRKILGSDPPYPRRKLLVGAIVAGALTVTAGTAFALSQDDQSSSGATPATTSAPTSLTTTQSTSSTAPTSSSSSSSASSAPAQLTADDAARIAQARYGGSVHEIEREVEHGRLEWKVEITGADGVTYDVRIDAVTGDVTRVDKDDDDRGDDRDDDHGRHGGDDDHDDD